jgi:anti-sigma regulatory factor (Ser/Thr protein kinase)
MPDESAVLSPSLPARSEAASAARRALGALNGSLHLVSAARLGDVQLLATELVTNAVRHGEGESVELAAYADAETLRVEVESQGAAFDPHASVRARRDDDGGWGLRIVQALAHRWGVRERTDGVCAWFEVDRPQREAPLPIEEPAPPPPGL